MQHCEERFLQLARLRGLIKPAPTSMSLQARILSCDQGQTKLSI